MEEQLEELYMHNVVTPRPAMQDNIAQQQHLSNSLEQAEAELNSQREDMEEMQNDIVNLSVQLSKVWS